MKREFIEYVVGQFCPAMQIRGNKMRTIKFRQWNPSSKEFNTVGEIEPGRWGGPFSLDFNKYPLGQFTGLKDEDGKEIHEGDIIQYEDLHESTTKLVGEIVFEGGTFCIREFKLNWKKERELYRMWKDGIHDWYSIEQLDLFKVKIVGNIYEDPELLK